MSQQQALLFRPQPVQAGQPFALRYPIQGQIWNDEYYSKNLKWRISTSKLAKVITGTEPLYVISWGGGVDSTAMIVWAILTKKIPLDAVMFSDTGDELPETYGTILYFKQWIEAHGIPVIIVANNYGKTLSQYFYEKGIIPSKLKRDCTTKFKIAPMRRYFRESFGKQAKIVKYIGYNFDEKRRVDKAQKNSKYNPSYETCDYPLYDYRIGRKECIDLIKAQNLPVPEKSGCFHCIFTCKAGWAMQHAEHPELFQEAKKFESNSREFEKSLTGEYKRPVFLGGGRHLGELEHEFNKAPLKTIPDPESGKRIFVTADGQRLTSESRIGAK